MLFDPVAVWPTAFVFPVRSREGGMAVDAGPVDPVFVAHFLFFAFPSVYACGS